MKIGLITLWGCTGYGQNLQMYALYKFMRDAGHDVYLIRYPMIEFQGENPVKWRRILDLLLPPFALQVLKKMLRQKTLKNIFKDKKSLLPVPPYQRFYRDPSYDIHLRQIGKFLDDYIIQSEKFYLSFAALDADPPEADVYVTGSDQVWGFWGRPVSIARCETVRAYFLDFGKPEIKRIAYAASFGTRAFDKVSAEIIAPLMQKYNYISVREEAGLALCAACGVGNAEWVPDPTLLLTAEQYRALYQAENIREHLSRKEAYCVVFMTKDNIDFLASLYCWASKNRLGVYLIINSGLIQHTYKETYATIPEWLYLIDNAEYVVSDSYHCSVVSLIFGKRFGIIPFDNRENDLRFNDLFKRFEIKHRYLTDDDFSALESDLDKTAVSATLQDIYRKYNAVWLNGILI